MKMYYVVALNGKRFNKSGVFVGITVMAMSSKEDATKIFYYPQINSYNQAKLIALCDFLKEEKDIGNRIIFTGSQELKEAYDNNVCHGDFTEINNPNEWRALLNVLLESPNPPIIRDTGHLQDTVKDDIVCAIRDFNSKGGGAD